MYVHSVSASISDYQLDAKLFIITALSAVPTDDIHVLGTAPECDDQDVLLDVDGGCELRHMAPSNVPQVCVPYTSFSGR
jgi:hypothetical protein